jgi:hypothetical protein
MLADVSQLALADTVCAVDDLFPRGNYRISPPGPARPARRLGQPHGLWQHAQALKIARHA